MIVQNCQEVILNHHEMHISKQKENESVLKIRGLNWIQQKLYYYNYFMINPMTCQNGV